MEVSEWVISMKSKLKTAQEYAAKQPWQKWSIYRVPRRLREAQDNKLAYVPQTVSIGPYHNTDDQVQLMDRHKWIALHRILERTGHDDLNIYLNAIKQVEQQARACFQQDLAHLSSNEFVQMLLLDGCFILELLFQSSPKAKASAAAADLEAVIYSRTMLDDILLDLVMLENQIPLFILDVLLQIICNNNQHNYQALDLALNLFNPEWLTGIPISATELRDLKLALGNRRCLHILDIFRQSLLHQAPQQNPIVQHKPGWRIYEKFVPGCLEKWFQFNFDSKRKQRHYPEVIQRVSELQESGIKLKKSSRNQFWDIKFNRGVLEIPTLWIQDGTKSILLNLAAFEQCHLNMTESVIASYVVFMECLIKTPEDVNYLNRHGIVQHLLGDDTEVVDMFKSVAREMLTDAHSNCYAKIAEQVNAYSSQRRNRWRASLIRNYFNNPWGIISLVAAFILLLLTVIQTIYTVWSFYRPT